MGSHNTVQYSHGPRIQETWYLLFVGMVNRAELGIVLGKDSTETTVENYDEVKGTSGGSHT